MRYDKQAIIERVARAMVEDTEDLDWGDVHSPEREVFLALAERIARSALPGLFAEPPECWVAPMELTNAMILALPLEGFAGIMGNVQRRVIIARQVETDWAAMRTAYLAEQNKEA